DWAQVFLKLAQGELQNLKWKSVATACVVLAAEGYPESPKNGVKIEGDLNFNSNTSYFLHAGTAKNEAGMWTTQGGRVLNSMGIGANLAEALKQAYAQAERVRWPGLQMRKDIGHKMLSKS